MTWYATFFKKFWAGTFSKDWSSKESWNNTKFISKTIPLSDKSFGKKKPLVPSEMCKHQLMLDTNLTASERKHKIRSHSLSSSTNTGNILNCLGCKRSSAVLNLRGHFTKYFQRITYKKLFQFHWMHQIQALVEGNYIVTACTPFWYLIWNILNHC